MGVWYHPKIGGIWHMIVTCRDRQMAEFEDMTEICGSLCLFFEFTNPQITHTFLYTYIFLLKGYWRTWNMGPTVGYSNQTLFSFLYIAIMCFFNLPSFPLISPQHVADSWPCSFVKTWLRIWNSTIFASPMAAWQRLARLSLTLGRPKQRKTWFY